MHFLECALQKFMKRFFLIAVLFSMGALCSAQSENDSKKISVSPYANLGFNITVNTASKEKSAPPPVNFAGGMGAIIDITDFITLEPRLDFWAMYYLFDGKDALPAEIEQRTASVLCFMLDVPVGFNFRKGSHTFTPGAGLGILMRFAFLSSGVKPDDHGATGSAQGDAEKIASWFWGKGRFLYPEVFFAWDYSISEKLRAGLTARIYLPLGSIIDGKGLDATIINLSTRFVF